MRSLYIFIAVVFLASCAGEEKLNAATAEGGYRWAKELDDDERYEEALALYAQVKNKHPYSKYAVDSELAIADIHYKREAFVEAQHAYQTFKEFHPKHKRIAYVTFRLAMSFYNQLPSTEDRDLTQAHRSILYFDEVITSFPNSEYVKESIQSKRKTIEMLASKVYYIAEFYFIRKFWLSARLRFENLLTKYPRTGFDARALYGAAVSANQLGEKAVAARYFARLKAEYPKSDEFRRAQREFSR